MTTTLILFVAGLVLLIVGAEALVRGASRLAAMIGISPLVIGLTVVAFGTSSPELAVSVQSGLANQADIALGNVVGSNIFNILLILGISASITPLLVSQQLIKLDVPLMIAVSVLMLVLGLDGMLDKLDGLVLMSGIIAYILFMFYQSRKDIKETQERKTRANGSDKSRSIQRLLIDLLLIVGGLAFLVLGSRWLVKGAIVIAQSLGVSELVIGLTIVAAGTSLPEVATSVIASIRGERDIAVGNVVGSNIFNILAVLGLTSIVAPQGIHVSPAILHFDIPVMTAAAIACLPIFFTGHAIARWEGLLFLGYYLAYTAFLILKSTQHAMLPVVSAVMMAFVIPITVLTLIVVTWRAIRAGRNQRR